MADRSVRITLRDRQVSGGSIPGSALMGEPFVNLFNGILAFSAVTGGDYETSSQAGVFEAGSKLYNQKITNRLNINDNFIISGDTGLISTYAGVTGAGLSGKFLSGTTTGLVLANISDIQGVTTYVQNGTNITTGGTPNLPTVNLVASPSVNNITYSGTSTGGNSIATNVSATTFYSAATNLETIIYNVIASSGPHTFVQPGSNITTGGTSSNPIVSVVSSPSLNALTLSGAGQFAGVTATSLSANTLSGGTILSGGTNLYNIFQKIGDVDGVANVNAGSNITTGGTETSPIINLAASPSVNNITFSGTAIGGNVQAAAGTFTSLSATTLSGDTIYSGGTNLQNVFNSVNSQLATKANLSGATFTGAISAPGVSDSTLTSGWAVYAGAGGALKTNSGFTYDETSKILFGQNLQVGSSSLSGSVTIWGDLTIMGEAVSAFTSQLYVEDNNVELNFNPTASTTSTSLGAGITIQDGSGVAGTDVFWDIRGTATTVDNRSFATNLNDIRIRETGTSSSPNGVRVLAEFDVLDGGFF